MLAVLFGAIAPVVYVFCADVALRDDDCCAPLRAALAADRRYRLVYEGPGATVFVPAE